MANDRRFIDLEAYLDGELAPAETVAFEAALEADAELRAELDLRLAERGEYRAALGEDVSSHTSTLDSEPVRPPLDLSSRLRRFPYSRTGFALAACLALVILVPRMLRNDDGAEGPRSTITMSGQVTVVRYGERPGETTVIETGAIELPAGLGR